LIIAITALIRTSRHNKFIRQHSYSTVRPYLHIDAFQNDYTYKLRLTNTGLGPAIKIRTTHYYYDNGFFKRLNWIIFARHSDGIKDIVQSAYYYFFDKEYSKIESEYSYLLGTKSNIKNLEQPEISYSTFYPSGFDMPPNSDKELLVIKAKGKKAWLGFLYCIFIRLDYEDLHGYKHSLTHRIPVNKNFIQSNITINETY
jgi:hypothetical protein